MIPGRGRMDNGIISRGERRAIGLRLPIVASGSEPGVGDGLVTRRSVEMGESSHNYAG